MTRMNVSGIRFFFPALIRILNQSERQRRCPRYFDFGKKETEKMELFHCINFPASRIRYEITRGNFGGAFAVKNMTGAIFVAGPLDYETRRRVSFKDSPSPDY